MTKEQINSEYLIMGCITQRNLFILGYSGVFAACLVEFIVNLMKLIHAPSAPQLLAVIVVILFFIGAFLCFRITLLFCNRVDEVE